MFYILNPNEHLLKYDNGVDPTNLKKRCHHAQHLAGGQKSENTRTDPSALFGDKSASRIVLLKSFNDYWNDYEDKEIPNSIRKAADASIQLRSKKELIEAFISRVNIDTQVTTDGYRFILEQVENEETVISAIKYYAVSTDKDLNLLAVKGFRFGVEKVMKRCMDLLL